MPASPRRRSSSGGCLSEEKLSRHDLGREGLVERIWQWKKEYEARIIGQLKQMGCSCDWQRTRFTLDDGLRPGGARTRSSTCSRTADLSRQAAGQLGHVPANGRQRRRSVPRDGEGPFLALQVSGDRSEAGRADARDHRHHAARDDARRYGRGRASRSGRGAWTRPRPSCASGWPTRPAKEKPDIQAQLDEIARAPQDDAAAAGQAPRHGPAPAAS